MMMTLEAELLLQSVLLPALVARAHPKYFLPLISWNICKKSPERLLVGNEVGSAVATPLTFYLL